MGMQLEMTGLTEAEARRVLADPEEVWELESDDVLSLDKGWHGLHYLLSGSTDEAPWPNGFLLSDGDSIGPDDETVLYFSPERVRSLADWLPQVTVESLRGRFDPDHMADLGVYPDIWRSERDSALEWLIGLFEKMRSFVSDVAANGKALAITIG